MSTVAKSAVVAVTATVHQQQQTSPTNHRSCPPSFASFFNYDEALPFTPWEVPLLNKVKRYVTDFFITADPWPQSFPVLSKDALASWQPAGVTSGSEWVKDTTIPILPSSHAADVALAKAVFPYPPIRVAAMGGLDYLSATDLLKSSTDPINTSSLSSSFVLVGSGTSEDSFVIEDTANVE